MLNVVLIAALSSWLVLLGLLPQLRSRLLDQPNSRSSHCQPTPRGGGIAFVLVTFIASCMNSISHPSAMAALPFWVLPLALVGLLDDRHQVPAIWRYLVQLVTALLIISTSPLMFKRPDGLPWISQLILIGELPILWSAVGLVLMLIIITAVINFTNFMDGIDGLVAGCMSVGLGVLSLQLDAVWSIWALVGALLGFLFWNWSPAKVFMGDVGSTFLGAMFIGLVLQSDSWKQALSCLLVATPLLADACSCVVRRLVDGQDVFKPHRLHLYQRLQQSGWTHAKVSIVYVVATALLALAVLKGGLSAVIFIAMAEITAGLFLDRYVAVPFFVASSD